MVSCICKSGTTDDIVVFRLKKIFALCVCSAYIFNKNLFFIIISQLSLFLFRRELFVSLYKNEGSN